MIINQPTKDNIGRKKTKKTDEGVPFRTQLGESGNYVTVTLYNAERIKEYPGMRLTVVLPGQKKKEAIYGHPDETLLGMYEKKGKNIEKTYSHL